MLSKLITEIEQGYLKARQQDFASHPLANFIKKETSGIIQEIAKDLIGENWDLRGSPGQGGWAEVPWIALLDPLVTSTPRKGYYICYLFSADMKSVHLSFNQGSEKIIRMKQ